MEEVRILRERMEAMEVARHWDLDVGYVSESDEESFEGKRAEGSAKMRVLRSTPSSNSRPNVEIATYGGSLDTEELIDWITALNKYFDYE